MSEVGGMFGADRTQISFLHASVILTGAVKIFIYIYMLSCVLLEALYFGTSQSRIKTVIYGTYKQILDSAIIIIFLKKIA